MSELMYLFFVIVLVSFLFGFIGNKIGYNQALIEYNLGGYDEKTGEFIEYRKEELKDE